MLKSADRKTTIRPQHRAVVLPEQIPSRRVKLGQNFVLDVATIGKRQRLTVSSLVDGKAIPCPHVFSVLLGKDITGDHYDMPINGLFATIQKLITLTQCEDDAPAAVQADHPRARAA